MLKTWTVTSHLINGKMMYAVCRMKDFTKPVHGDNVEFATGYLETIQEANQIAKKLNKEKQNV